MATSWRLWTVLGCLGWTMVYADRAIFGPLLEPIGRTFAVGPAALGLLGTAFFFAYTALQIPAGLLADRVRPRPLFVLSFLGFGASVLASAFAPAYAVIVLLALISGAFQSVYFPVQYAVTTRHVPTSARGTATAVINGGMGVGVAAGFAIAAAPFFLAHWEILLALAGAATMVLALAFARLAPAEPPGGRLSNGGGPVLSRDLVLLSVANFGSLFGFFFFLTWFPYYLETVVGLTGGLLSLTAAAAPVVSLPAGVLWVRLLGPRRRAGLLALFPLAAAALALVPMARGTAPLLALLVVYGLVGKLAVDPLVLGETGARLPKERLGAGFGVLNFSGMLASVVAPVVAGWMAAHLTHGLDDAFYLSAALLLVSTAAAAALPRLVRPALSVPGEP